MTRNKDMKINLAGMSIDDVNVEEEFQEKLSPQGYEPTKKGIAYKVFKVKNGKLYPPMVANHNNEDTPIGVWLDAEEGEFAGLSKTGRPQVKSTGSGNLSYRPGWHLGDVPRASQFDRTNKETGEKEFPKDFVWAECEYAMDVDYQPESDARGYERTKVDDQGNVVTYKSDKYQHSLAGVPHLPTNGYYKYRTNPNPDTVPWVITGQMKVKRLLSDEEVNNILKSKGIAPIHRQGGDKTLSELGLRESYKKFGYVKQNINESKEDQEKFRNWIIDGLKTKGYNEPSAIEYADKDIQFFNKIKNSLSSNERDIYYWMKKPFDDFYWMLNKKGQEAQEKDDLTKKEQEGAKLLYSDNTWKVYEITTYEASAKYGRNTKWCITGTKRWHNNGDGSNTFKDYKDRGVRFFFFINNKENHKYAISVYPNNDFEIWDDEDIAIGSIPNAPVVKEIGVNYWDNNEEKVLRNVILYNKLPNELTIRLLEDVLIDTACEGEGNAYIESVDDALVTLDGLIPDGYLEHDLVDANVISEDEFEEITDEPYNEDWGGDYPLVDSDFIFDLMGTNYNNETSLYKTKSEALTPSNPCFSDVKYVAFIEEGGEGQYYVYTCKSWEELLHRVMYYQDEYDYNILLDNLYRCLANRLINGEGITEDDMINLGFSPLFVKKLMDGINEDDLTSYLKESLSRKLPTLIRTPIKEGFGNYSSKEPWEVPWYRAYKSKYGLFSTDGNYGYGEGFTWATCDKDYIDFLDEDEKVAKLRLKPCKLLFYKHSKEEWKDLVDKYGNIGENDVFDTINPTEYEASIMEQEGFDGFLDGGNIYVNKDFLEVIDDDIKLENESLEESVEKHDTLNPKLFNEDNTIKEEVRNKLLEIANFFMDKAKEDGVEFDVKDILIVGSNANYNYTNESDIDLHIVVSKTPQCNKPEHLGIIYQAYKSMFNNKYDCTINGVPVEVYVEFEDEDVIEDPTEETNIEESVISPTTPYMLRNDGKLLECGIAHPYVKISLEQGFEASYKEFKNHPQWIEWLVENSNQEEVKSLCKKEELTEDEFNKLNDLVNQEFCRVRTSNFKYQYGGNNGEIYFRISSKNFNWFDLIWQVVMNYKNGIKNVTVMKDSQSLGGKDFDYYVVDGKKLSHIDVEEFLTLKGNPVLEGE